MLKQTSKKFRIITILLAVVFTAQSCNLFGGGQRQETIELTWWKTFDAPELVQPLVAEFQKQYPHIKIRYVQKDIETYETELLNALAAGEGPDIFTIHNDWLAKHINKMEPAPEQYFSARKLRDEYIQVVSDDLVSANRVYAVPLAMDVLAMYYNKDILSSAGMARPPTTWEELVDAVPRIARQDSLGNFQRQAVAMGTADNVNRASDIFELMLLQNGTPLYSEDRRSALFGQRVRSESGDNYVPGAEALSFYTSFANPAKENYTWNNRSNNSIEAFAAGRVAMMFSYSYLRETLAGKAPFLNYDAAPFPQPAGTLNRINFANYWAEGVAKQSENKEAAWFFLEFISRPDILPLYYQAQKQVSPRIDILEQQISDPVIGVFAENALSARGFFEPDSDAVERIFVQAINDVALRNISPESAIQSAEQKVNLLLRSR